MAPLIAAIARQYQRYPGVEQDELLQEGALGVLQAAQRYDGSFDTPFAAYASWWVRQGMQRVASELSGPVVLSDRAHRQLARMRDGRRAHLQRTGREPSATRLSELTGLSLERIASLVVAGRRRARSTALPPGKRTVSRCMSSSPTPEPTRPTTASSNGFRGYAWTACEPCSPTARARSSARATGSISRR
jgi:DNA-directed RNA polymerase sigma subunit (sigma70/sigma32)